MTIYELTISLDSDYYDGDGAKRAGTISVLVSGTDTVQDILDCVTQACPQVDPAQNLMRDADILTWDESASTHKDSDIREVGHHFPAGEDTLDSLGLGVGDIFYVSGEAMFSGRLESVEERLNRDGWCPLFDASEFDGDWAEEVVAAQECAGEPHENIEDFEPHYRIEIEFNLRKTGTGENVYWRYSLKDRCPTPGTFYAYAQGFSRGLIPERCGRVVVDTIEGETEFDCRDLENWTRERLDLEKTPLVHEGRTLFEFTTARFVVGSDEIPGISACVEFCVYNNAEFWKLRALFGRRV